MITCKECLERCYPSNPKLDGGCDYYCDKPTYYRELENQPAILQEQRIINLPQKDMARLMELESRVKVLTQEIVTRRLKRDWL